MNCVCTKHVTAWPTGKHDSQPNSCLPVCLSVYLPTHPPSQPTNQPAIQLARHYAPAHDVRGDGGFGEGRVLRDLGVGGHVVAVTCTPVSRVSVGASVSVDVSASVDVSVSVGVSVDVDVRATWLR